MPICQNLFRSSARELDRERHGGNGASEGLRADRDRGKESASLGYCSIRPTRLIYGTLGSIETRLKLMLEATYAQPESLILTESNPLYYPRRTLPQRDLNLTRTTTPGTSLLLANYIVLGIYSGQVPVRRVLYLSGTLVYFQRQLCGNIRHNTIERFIKGWQIARTNFRRLLRVTTVTQAEDGVQAPKHVLPELEAGDDGNCGGHFCPLGLSDISGIRSQANDPTGRLPYRSSVFLEVLLLHQEEQLLSDGNIHQENVSPLENTCKKLS
ncbi:hypothetical protein AAG570_001309 [Ranatra chinensis]|uniref:Uncharacterized protein n=1 Tax=Ranatra chinensis TaxID=642074 RepID=A0ABD0YBJ1_9HEMI